MKRKKGLNSLCMKAEREIFASVAVVCGELLAPGSFANSNPNYETVQL